MTVPNQKVTVHAFLPLSARQPLDLPSNKLEATSDDLERLKASSNSVPATADAVQYRVHNRQPELHDGVRVDPILALLEIVCVDSMAFAQSLAEALDEIGKDSLDDYLMERRLADWRRLMNSFQIEIPAIRNSVHDFVDYFFGQSLRPPSIVEEMVKRLDRELESLSTKIDETYTALRVDMQFSESRRSINEAKTVTRVSGTVQSLRTQILTSRALLTPMVRSL